MTDYRKATIADLILAVDKLHIDLGGLQGDGAPFIEPDIAFSLEQIRASLSALHTDGNYRGMQFDDWIVIHERDHAVDLINLSGCDPVSELCPSITMHKAELERQFREFAKGQDGETFHPVPDISHGMYWRVPSDIADDLEAMSLAEDKGRRHQPPVIRYWQPFPQANPAAF